MLITVSVASTGIYALLTARMPLTRFFPGPGETIDFKDMLGPDRTANALLLYGAFAALLLLWLIAVSAVRGQLPARVRLLVFAGPLLFIAALAPMYPPMAVDFFHYLADGRLLWQHGGNPLTDAPGPYFPIRISYGDQPSAYGPLWYLLLGPPVLAGGDNDQRALLLLKLWMAVFYIIAAVLTWIIARRLSPGREALAVVLLAWNPLVAWRVLGNGHNDVVMLCLLLAALLAAARRRWLLIGPLLIASVLVKYVSLLAAPAFIIYTLRRPPDERGPALRRLGAGGVAALLATVALYAPFWQGRATFAIVETQATKYITSTPLLLGYQIWWWTPMRWGRALDLASLLLTLAFVGVVGVLLLRQRRGPAELVAAAALTFLAYNLLAVNWFRPWYFLWIVMLTPLLPGRWWLTLTAVVSAAGLAPDVIEQYGRSVPWLRADHFLLLAAPVLPAFLPPAVVWLTGIRAGMRVRDEGSPPDR